MISVQTEQSLALQCMEKIQRVNTARNNEGLFLHMEDRPNISYEKKVIL